MAQRQAEASDRTLRSRFECKYIISPMIVAEVREFIRPFMKPDRFAAMREDYRYPICSLYLDSEDLRLYHQTEGGHRDRYKLRIRTYSDDPATPAFLEVKNRINTIVRKNRVRLERQWVPSLLGLTTDDAPTPPTEALDTMAYFRHQMAFARARPVVRVRYMREAYESRGDDPVRITLDTQLRHAVTMDDNLSHEDGRWVSTPTPGTILELKFTERYPSFIRDIVRVFGLMQQAVPKYVWSMEHVLHGGREATFGLDGVELPPMRTS
ncbi:MAG: polyphosphate polymerase domain-containing protein [Acidobacteriota bacterium]|nr:polyphosphate polymerase domain-containing protein [Acidobacteriota bacterium]MDH3786609.1 polyphosphate polymerase domain-containing protein [Acidobacteriota bacterium]